MLLAVDVLGDDGGTVFAGKALSTTIHAVVLVVIIVKGTDSLAFTNSAVAHSSGTVVLPAQVEGLQEEHDGYTADGGKKQDNLDSSLARVELLFDGTRLQEHVDEHVEQTRWVCADGIPVD